jgi:hypothetical protein
MTKTGTKITTLHKREIPKVVLPELAKFMAYSKLEPGLSPEFFLDWLSRPITKEWKEKYGANISFALKENVVVAWGHFSWSKKSEFTPELYVKVHHGEMRKGIGSQMIRELLEKIPDYVQELTIPAMKEEFGSKFVQSKLNGKVIEEDRRGLLKVREVDYDETIHKIKAISKDLKKQGIRIQFFTVEDLINNNMLPSIVKLIEQNEIDFSLSNWTKDKETKKTLDYKKKIEASKRNESIHEYFLAIKGDNEEVIAYTHTARNFERNKLLAWHEKTIFDPNQKNETMGLLLIIHMLKLLQDNTKVTHWIVQNMYDDDFLLKIFEKAGFEYFVTNLIHRVKRKNWEQYLNRSKE